MPRTADRCDFATWVAKHKTCLLPTVYIKSFTWMTRVCKSVQFSYNIKDLVPRMNWSLFFNLMIHASIWLNFGSTCYKVIYCRLNADDISIDFLKISAVLQVKLADPWNVYTSTSKKIISFKNKWIQLIGLYKTDFLFSVWVKWTW